MAPNRGRTGPNVGGIGANAGGIGPIAVNRRPQAERELGAADGTRVDVLSIE
jgi:hypothetical protein